MSDKSMTYSVGTTDSDSVNLGSNPSSPATGNPKENQHLEAADPSRSKRKSRDGTGTGSAQESAQFICWKAGKLVPGTPAEFTSGLRRFAGYADREFSTRSDPAGLIGERLNAAAKVIDMLIAQLHDPAR
jgi:hypothetical protein